MKSIKIGYIGIKGLPSLDGASRVVENIIFNLDKNKYKITVYSNGKYYPKRDHFSDFTKITIPYLPVSNNINTFLYFLNSALHSLFFGDYDLVHLHNIDCAFIIPILKLKYKVICTSHGSDFSELGKWGPLGNMYFKIMNWIFFKYSEYITTVSPIEARKYNTINSRIVCYIPNGVNLEEKPNIFDIDKILEQFDLKNEYILFSAGRIIPVKGLHILLNALIKINYKDKCAIIGDLNQTKEYRQTILKLIHETGSVYLGFIRDKSKLLGVILKSSIFVFPSLLENMSMMLLEVASIKTPIICSDIPANTAIFSDDEVLFFKSGDVQDLAEKLKWAISNPDEMKKKSLRAYNKVNKKYLWSNITKQYEKLYQQILR